MTRLLESVCVWLLPRWGLLVALTAAAPPSGPCSCCDTRTHDVHGMQAHLLRDAIRCVLGARKLAGGNLISILLQSHLQQARHTGGMLFLSSKLDWVPFFCF